MELSIRGFLGMSVKIFPWRGEPVGEVVKDEILMPPQVAYAPIDWDARRTRLAASFGTYEGPVWEAAVRGVEQER